MLKNASENACSYGAISEPTSEERLRQLGYKQELQRKLSSFATFGLSFANIGILSNTSATFQTVLQRGGPMTMVIGWNLVSMFIICIALSLSEICSLYPTAGGVYYWVYEMLHTNPKTKQRAPFIAFATGWMYTLANAIAIGANNVIVALSTASLIHLLSGYTVSQLGITAIVLVVTIVHGLLNSYRLQGLAWLNEFNVAWTCGGLVLLIALLATQTDHWQTLEWVLTDYENETGFDNPVYVFCLGMIGAGYSMFGFESAAYVNEETKDAEIAAPMAITMAIVTCWAIGLAFIVILLFSIQDVDALLHSQHALPVAQLFWDATGRYGTIGFLVLVSVCQFCTGVASMTATSRMIYALARDQATPMSNTLRKVNQHHLPGNAVAFTVFLSCLFVAPYPFSADLFETIVSATTITTHLAYMMVLGSRLSVSSHLQRKGRFHLGKLSTPVTWIGLCWTVFAVIVFALPTSWPFQASTMNYSGVALLGVIISTLAFWIGWGRHHYVGPRAQTDAIETHSSSLL